MSKDGINQGIRHFFEYWKATPDRIVRIAERLGIDPDTFSPTKEGFEKFTAAARNIVDNWEALGGQMRQITAEKAAYFYENVIVITSEGKLQTMMIGTESYFDKLK